MSRKIFANIFLFIALLGFLDATYLTLEHYRGAILPCYVVSGCNSVTTSQYSLIFSVPVALLGSLYYVTILILAIAYLDSKKEKILKILAQFTAVGFVASLWFIFTQAYLIKAWCVYCIGSALSSLLLFIFGMYYLYRHESWWQKLKEKL